MSLIQRNKSQMNVIVIFKILCESYKETEGLQKTGLTSIEICFERLFYDLWFIFNLITSFIFI